MAKSAMPCRRRARRGFMSASISFPRLRRHGPEHFLRGRLLPGRHTDAPALQARISLMPEMMRADIIPASKPQKMAGESRAIIASMKMQAKMLMLRHYAP